MAGVAAFVAVLALSAPSSCSASHGRVGFRGASPDRRVSTEKVEVNLRSALDGGVGQRRLARIEAAVWETFRALPKNEMGRLEPRAVRHIVNGYFAKEHGWVINGLEPHGMQPNASEVHEADILQDKAPAFVEALLEARRAGRGLSLSDVVAMAATLERLIVEESFAMLQAAYTLNGQTVVDTIDAAVVHDVLSSYLLIFEMGVVGDPTTDWRRHRAMKDAVAGAGGNWNTVLQFERDAVHSFDFETRHGANPFVPRRYSFRETSQIVESLAQDHGKWQNSECRAMKEELARLDPGGSGRVSLKAFHSKEDVTNFQFKESVDYLQKIGAYEEETNSVRIVNYLTGPSNCIAKSTYYSVCCLSECEGLMKDLERRIRAPATTPEHLFGVISNLTAPEDMRFSQTAAMSRLRDIADHNGGEVPLHGRLFAEFLHYAFPMECPYPHVAEDAADLAPTSWNSTLSAATDEERLFHLDAHHTDLAVDRAELEWSAEELLPLIEPAERAQRGGWSWFVRLAAQCAAVGAVLRSAMAALSTASRAGLSTGKGEHLVLPMRM